MHSGFIQIVLWIALAIGATIGHIKLLENFLTFYTIVLIGVIILGSFVMDKIAYADREAAPQSDFQLLFGPFAVMSLFAARGWFWMAGVWFAFAIWRKAAELCKEKVRVISKPKKGVS